MKQPIYGNMVLGTAYYPEHWDASLWEEDIIRMQAHGINLLRIGDFAWGKYEKQDGLFTIGYFDNFLSLCEKHQMEVVFCTPTAAPPMWLIREHPEVLNCDIEGNPYDGPRRHYTYNSETYRTYCERIVTKLAEHYSKRDIIVGWQIDNELNCDLSEFYSPADHVAYREYLKTKFGTLDKVNEALGLTFWSREYSDWQQVMLNRKNVGGAANPHLALEEKRFFSETAICFCAMQVKILRKYIPKENFITTNGLFANLDYNRLMKTGLSFITFDSYPNFAFDLEKEANQPGDLKDRKWSWNLMWTRSVSPVFGIMEQQAGANGWSSRMETPMPKPNQMTLWTMQSVAHGADFIAYFRWRTSPMGCEIYWHGLNDYANHENRRLTELTSISAKMKKLEEVRGATYKAKVAVLKDYSNEWDAAADCWHGRVAYYSDNSWFAATQKTHTPCDFIFLQDETTVEDFQTYELLVYPHPAILEKRTADLLEQYVKQGGTLVFGARTGYKDMYGKCPIRDMPGLISNWCGATVEEYTLVGRADEPSTAKWGDKLLETPVFNEALKVCDPQTEILAVFQGNDFKGAPALCRKVLGKGKVYHLGACFSEEMASAILEEAGKLTPYQDVLELPESVELAVRSDGETEYMFLLNYGSAEASIAVIQPLEELFREEVLEGIIRMEPYGVIVLKMTEPCSAR